MNVFLSCQKNEIMVHLSYYKVTSTVQDSNDIFDVHIHLRLLSLEKPPVLDGFQVSCVDSSLLEKIKFIVFLYLLRYKLLI